MTASDSALLLLAALAASSAILAFVILCGNVLAPSPAPHERLETSDLMLLDDRKKAEAEESGSVAFRAGGKTFVVTEGAKEALAEYL